MKILHALLALSIAASGASASTLELLRSINRQARDAAAAASARDARVVSGAGWDQGGLYRVGDDNIVSPSLLPKPMGPALKKPTANLVVGTPGAYRVREPKNPLNEDGTAKKKSSGNKFWWALGGLAAGAGVGFLLFGPIGALIGGLAAGLAGIFFGP
ncbi:MAG: hypothetical protein COB53_08980 [Elusimicrobia bacterium]|nr:MAG: hypothetical protein COB53_08980 [Elusimicrobiota bacterium]